MSAKLKKHLQERNRQQIRVGFSKLFTEMGHSKSAKGVLQVKNRKELEVYGHVAKGTYKVGYGINNPKSKKASELVDKLMGEWDR
jgi:hypothetical protein